MNVHESEKLAGILTVRGYIPAETEAEADVIVFNTCCVRETAETHIYGNLGRIKKLKESRPDIIVAVCGCMAQKPGGAEYIRKRCPFVNLIFGTHNADKFGEYLDAVSPRSVMIAVSDEADGIPEEMPVRRTSGVNAWVNIMYGCDNFCSYCIVPYVRGRERSRTPDAILRDIAALKEDYPQITLLGQNVNSYQGAPDFGFKELLQEIARLPGKFRVTFMTSHPKDLSEDVVKTIAENDKLAKFIHLPFQAGSDRILQLMNRKYTVDEYLRKIDMIRSYIPDVGLSADVMVGFPTETEEDFLDTIRVVEKVRFNNLYTFIYSRRSGTPADRMEQVEPSVKKDRIRRLIDVQARVGREVAAGTVGKSYEVLFDSYDGVYAGGKTETGMPVSVKSTVDVTGQFKPIKITACKNSKLYGTIEGA